MHYECISNKHKRTNFRESEREIIILVVEEYVWVDPPESRNIALETKIAAPLNIEIGLS